MWSTLVEAQCPAVRHTCAARTTAITDPRGAVTYTTHDYAGNMLTSTIGFGSSTPRTWTREHDLKETATRLLDPNGSDIRYAFDWIGRMAEINAPGTPLERREWDAWGNERSSTGTPCPFGWTGEQFDASSDLVFLRARFYSPGTEQFLNRDSVQPNAGDTTGYNGWTNAKHHLGRVS